MYKTQDQNICCLQEAALTSKDTHELKEIKEILNLSQKRSE
jgi:hypothetical protein